MSVQTKRRLIESAKKVFSERGYYNAQISHIIDEAGVARGTFYLYFRSKEEIFKEILNEVVEELKRRIKPLDINRNPVEQIVENIASVIDFALKNKELAIIVLKKNCDSKLFKDIEEFYEEITELIKKSLIKGIELGIIRKCDTDIVARTVLGSVKEVILSLLDKENVNVNKVAEELVLIGLKGIFKGGEVSWKQFTIEHTDRDL